jgi:hypothetical protein
MLFTPLVTHYAFLEGRELRSSETLSPPSITLKAEFQSKLKNSRIMGVHGVQEGTPRQAILSASSRSRIIGRGAAVAGDDVVAGIPGMRQIVDPELGVVENVERFGAEFEFPFAGYFKMLQQGNIEIRTSGIVE